MNAPNVPASQPFSLPGRHLYRLEFLAGVEGIGKRLEFNAPDLCQALEFILQDPAQRSVEVWEDGNFVFSVTRELPSN